MSTDSETIKSYDEHAEAWAKRQKSKKSMSHMHLEKPAMLGRLPDLEDKSVLCLGCGSGEECEALKKRGASRVVGIDISKGLIEQAKYAYPRIEFQVMDMEQLDFPESSFDFVYSSLVLHYVPDWSPTLQAVKKVLKLGQTFLFSTHHPIRFASETVKNGAVTTSKLGFEVKDGTDEFKVYGDYLNPHSLKDLWFDKIRVTYYHKPFANMIQEILDSGFGIKAVIEPKASESGKKIRPDFYAINQKIPLFILFELTKLK